MQIFKKIGLSAILLSALLIPFVSAQTLNRKIVVASPASPDSYDQEKPAVDEATDQVFPITEQPIKPVVYATASRPTVAGTCDTAGPIEVESSGGTAAGTPTAYATLGAAFAAINDGATHLGTITIDVCGDTTEGAAATLNEVAGVTSVTIAPAGGAARTISGIVAGEGLILLNGADNVTIDGLNSGGNSLTISNTAAVATTGTSNHPLYRRRDK